MKMITVELPVLPNGDFDLTTQLEIAAKHNIIVELKAKAQEYEQVLKGLRVTLDDFSTTQSKEIKIGDIFDCDIFDFSEKTNRSFFTKTFINQHAGNIPVYSASTDPNFVNYGYVQDNLPNVKYFHDCMTWNIDGSVGKVFIRKGKFFLSEKVIPLILFPQYKDHLDMYYLKYLIEEEAKKINFGFTNKAGKDKIQNIVIQILILSNGKFDIRKQQEIATTYKKVEETKKLIQEELKRIQEFSLVI